MKLAVEGIIVIVHGRDRALAVRVTDEIVASGGRTHVVVGDLTRDDDLERLAGDAVALAGPIDILVNNAGGSGGKSESWEQSRPEAWASSYDRNVLAAIRVTTRLLPAMRSARWGRVVNISSVAATMPPATGADYAACKAAVNAMTTSLAKAVAADGVTVNAVSPGTIHSAALDAAFRRVAAQRAVTDPGAPWSEVERVALPVFAQTAWTRVTAGGNR